MNSEGSVDNAVQVFITAYDQYGNVAEQEGRTCVLVANGSVTGIGVVSIQAGRGSKYLRNSVPEVVQISIQANANSSWDTRSTLSFRFNSGKLRTQNLTVRKCHVLQISNAFLFKLARILRLPSCSVCRCTRSVQ